MGPKNIPYLGQIVTSVHQILITGSPFGPTEKR